MVMMWLPIFFYHGTIQWNYRKMTIKVVRLQHNLILIHTYYYFSILIQRVGSRRVGAQGTTGSHKMKSSVIRSFLAHTRDVIRPIGSSYKSNDVFVIYLQ